MRNTAIAFCLSLAFCLIAFAGVASAKDEINRKEIEKIVEEYINAHPDVIERSMRAYYERMKQEAANKELADAFANRQTVSVEGSPVLGEDSAKITIVEFSDFQCPYCSRSVQTMKDLRIKYGNLVRLVYKHFPLVNHTNAHPAAIASMAAGKQGKFWEMHDALMMNQHQWGAADSKEMEDIVSGYAKALGLDMQKFKKDLKDPSFEETIKRDINLGMKLSIQATPTFFVNGVQVRGAVDISYFSMVIDRLLKEK